jgi:hypothetical protein
VRSRIGLASILRLYAPIWKDVCPILRKLTLNIGNDHKGGGADIWAEDLALEEGSSFLWLESIPPTSTEQRMGDMIRRVVQALPVSKSYN